jgi:endoglycosylceramidase
MEGYGYERDEHDWPLISECNKKSFPVYYTSAESLAVFDALYTNKHNLTDAFVNYWRVVANRFAKNPNVIGFDPINEPFPSDFIEDPSILQDGVFDRNKLAPLYEKVYKVWQEANPNSIMYFETGQYPDEALGKVYEAGFEKPPGGEKGSPFHVLNDHSYCCQLSPEICSSGEPPKDKAEECYNWHADRILTRASDA